MKQDIEMVIPSTPEQIHRVEAKAEKLARRFGFSQDDLDSLAIAITEIVANAIYHGNKKDPDKTVSIRFVCTTEALIVSVRDQGGGFKPNDLADPLAPENLLKGSGRGIFIVRTLVDDLQFKFHHDGTEVILTKNR
ncbi:ATP-binding protein [candidate division KSB1 bacterium]|nr:ATP-binding protein [candidate division KSB1 bacterium]